MTAIKGKGPLVDPGLCRCCGNLKKCRLLNVEYTWLGRKEVYSEMFIDCFGLVLSHLDGEAEERLICATCVTRLRDASLFRQQVLQCEEKLLSTYIQIHDGDKRSTIKKETDIKDENDDEQDINHIQCEDTDPADDHYDTETINNEDKSDIKPETTLSTYVNTTNTIDTDSKISKKPTRTKRSVNRKVQVSERMTRKGKIKKLRNKSNKERQSTKQHVKIEFADFLPISKSYSVKDKSLMNAATIVENSYVCPFNTFFNNFYCMYCRQKFLDPEKLREHTLTHDPSTYKDIFFHKIIRNGNKKCQIDLNRIDCRLCDEKITDLDTFKAHITKVHEKVFYATPSTPEVIILKSLLTNNNFKCTECGKVFMNFHGLKLHMAEHFGTYVCDICGAHYFEERMLVAHLKSHKPSDNVYPCNECKKTFKCKYNLTIHIARYHTKKDAYLCAKCDETFFSNTLRRRHMIEVHKEESVFKCKYCEKIYDNKKTLGDHIRRIHLKLLKHQCNICEKRFFLPCRLKEHMSCHTGERNFKCEHCGKCYSRLRALKVHILSHNSIKRFKCNLCTASYNQNVCLKNHMKRQHQNAELENSFQS